MLPAILYFLLLTTDTGKFLAFALLCIAVATDYFDGFFARKWHQVSEFGKIIDPVADKICVGAVGIVFVILEIFPLWFLLIILIRDLLILLAGMWLKNAKHMVFQSNLTGKWTVTIIALTFLLALILPPQHFVVQILIYCSTGMLFISFAQYVLRFYKTMFKSLN